MPELNEILEIDPADVSDDDFLLIFDNSAPSSKSRKTSRVNLLKGVAREGGDHNFGVVEIDDLTAQDATFVNATVTTSLKFDTAATIQKMYKKSEALIFSDLSAGAGQTLVMTVTGVAVGDHISFSFDQALPDGITMQGWVSASNAVSIRLFNTGSGLISGATYTAYVTAMRFL